MSSAISAVSPLFTVTSTRPAPANAAAGSAAAWSADGAELALAAVEIGDGEPVCLDGVDDARPGKQRDRTAGQRQAAAGIAADAAGAGHGNPRSLRSSIGPPAIAHVRTPHAVRQRACRKAFTVTDAGAAEYADAA